MNHNSPQTRLLLLFGLGRGRSLGAAEVGILAGGKSASIGASNHSSTSTSSRQGAQRSAFLLLGGVQRVLVGLARGQRHLIGHRQVRGRLRAAVTSDLTSLTDGGELREASWTARNSRALWQAVFGHSLLNKILEQTST